MRCARCGEESMDLSLCDDCSKFCSDCYGSGVLWLEGKHDEPIEAECGSCYGTGVQTIVETDVIVGIEGDDNAF